MRSRAVLILAIVLALPGCAHVREMDGARLKYVDGKLEHAAIWSDGDSHYIEFVQLVRPSRIVVEWDDGTRVTYQNTKPPLSQTEAAPDAAD